PYDFFSTQGQQLLRRILRTRLRFDPHDYLLIWTAYLLSGHHLLGITATGDGKSCIFYFPLLVMQYFARNPSEKPAGWSWPDNPLCVVICPTKCIEEEQEADMRAIGINAVAVNQDRLADARHRGENLMTRARAADMLYVGPEILGSPWFAELLKLAIVYERIVLGGVDEAQLIMQWSDSGFRPRFLQIGHFMARLCPKARICAVSATILPGKAEQAICQALGIFWSDVVIKHRSNMRCNLQFERRLFKSALSGRIFSELNWIVAENRSALIFVDSITTSWRIAAYLCGLLPSATPAERRLRIRLYNSLNTAEHNLRTRDLLHQTPGTIAVATNSLSVGFSSSSIDTVAIINPTSLNDLVQKGGRANRVAGGGDTIGRAVVYIPPSAYKKADLALSSVDGVSRAGPSRKRERPMELELARTIRAPCITRTINTEYKNPSPAVCFCETCGGRPISGPHGPCRCDGC
ncbi:hypothetical protein EXIGLDRAFT_590227, partial [Exidia glandulosa HHB12029]